MVEWQTIVSVVKDLWWLISVPLTAIALLGMFYLRSQFPTKQQHDQQTATLNAAIKELKERVEESEREQDTRLGKLESDMRALPTRDEVAALGDRIGRVEKEVATSTETTRGVEKTVNKVDHTLGLILEHLLKEKKA